jgi:SAM-dependent methyltransferase
MGEANIMGPNYLESEPFEASFRTGVSYGPVETRFDVNEQYGDNTANVRMRFEVYKHAVDNLPVTHDRVMGILQSFIKGDESHLDTGCADREFLYQVRKNINPAGRLVGLDAVDLYSGVDKRLEGEKLKPIEFRIEKASETTLEDNSFDVITALFMLYHDPEALGRLHSLLKDDGLLIIATSGKDNKKFHRQFEEFGARFIRDNYPNYKFKGFNPVFIQENYPELAEVQAPPIFSAEFDEETALRELPKYFKDNVIHLPQRTFMKIDDPSSAEAYRMSLVSMASAFRPPLRIVGPLWRSVIDNQIMPMVWREIKQKGYFLDYIDRHIFIAKKTAPSRAV